MLPLPEQVAKLRAAAADRRQEAAGKSLGLQNWLLGRADYFEGCAARLQAELDGAETATLRDAIRARLHDLDDGATNAPTPGQLRAALEALGHPGCPPAAETTGCSLDSPG